MSTRATVAVKFGTGYIAVYCHYDGDRLLQSLVQYYSNRETAEKLVTQGSIRELNHKVEFYVTDFEYMSDEYRTHFCGNYEELVEFAQDFCGAEHLYIYDNERWKEDTSYEYYE